MSSANQFLKGFLDMRAKMASAPDKQGPTALLKSSSCGTPLPGGMGLPKPTNEMLLKKIIDEKPGKKEVEKYFKMKSQESM